MCCSIKDIRARNKDDKLVRRNGTKVALKMYFFGTKGTNPRPQS